MPEEEHNITNYYTYQKDARKIENVVGNLAHENTHKAISETKFAEKHINKDQEAFVAPQVDRIPSMSLSELSFKVCRRLTRAFSGILSSDIIYD